MPTAHFRFSCGIILGCTIIAIGFVVGCYIVAQRLQPTNANGTDIDPNATTPLSLSSTPPSSSQPVVQKIEEPVAAPIMDHQPIVDPTSVSSIGPVVSQQPVIQNLGEPVATSALEPQPTRDHTISNNGPVMGQQPVVQNVGEPFATLILDSQPPRDIPLASNNGPVTSQQPVVEETAANLMSEPRGTHNTFASHR